MADSLSFGKRALNLFLSVLGIFLILGLAFLEQYLVFEKELSEAASIALLVVNCVLVGLLFFVFSTTLYWLHRLIVREAKDAREAAAGILPGTGTKVCVILIGILMTTGGIYLRITPIGYPLIIIGIGLMFFREWARRCVLGLIAIAAGFFLIMIAIGTAQTMEPRIPYFVAAAGSLLALSLPALLTAFYLTRPSVLACFFRPK